MESFNNLWRGRFTRGNVRAIRERLAAGMTPRQINLELFGKPHTDVTARVARDWASGGHEYDPIDDEVAVERVLLDRDEQTARRLSVFEMNTIMAALWERHREEVNDYAEMLGYSGCLHSFARACEAAWRRTQTGVS